MPDKIEPKILKVRSVATTKLFNVEQVDLQFSNGELRTFERLKPGKRKAVVIVAMPDSNTVLLIKEYAVGTESYEIGLPKGLVDEFETIEQAANRELQEEVGMKAGAITRIMALSLSPQYMSHSTELVLARNLEVSKLDGDEPEPLEVMPFNINDLDDLVLTQKIKEARSIASLYIIKNYLAKNNAI